MAPLSINLQRKAPNCRFVFKAGIGTRRSVKNDPNPLTPEPLTKPFDGGLAKTAWG
jgi:hypothetical protein